MISRKIRINALISYFFLGWIFLLAKNNPNFTDPFIKKHAKIATQGHIIFLVSYSLYSYFFGNFFSYSIPVIQITLTHVIDILFFAALILFIIWGVYRGYKDDNPLENTTNTPLSFFLNGHTFQFSGATEAERVIFLVSYIPFLGMIITKKYPNIVTTTGARVSSIFWFIYLVSFVNNGFDSLSMILLFIGILSFVFLAARFFMSNTYIIPNFFNYIPDIDSIYRIIRSIPSYIKEVSSMIFGKNTTLSFVDNIKNVKNKDTILQESLQEYFTDKTLLFQSFWIFIPFFNLIFLPKLFTCRTTQYVLAIWQGLVITLLAIIIGLLFSFTSPLELFLLFPIFYGIASIETNVFVRIPLLYEIYAIINTLTFGLLKNTKRIQTIQKQDTTVSFKME